MLLHRGERSHPPPSCIPPLLGIRDRRIRTRSRRGVRRKLWGRFGCVLLRCINAIQAPHPTGVGGPEATKTPEAAAMHAGNEESRDKPRAPGGMRSRHARRIDCSSGGRLVAAIGAPSDGSRAARRLTLPVL
jgi:hypothetical protein